MYRLSWDEFLILLPKVLPILMPVMLFQLALIGVALISIFRKKMLFSQIVVWIIIVILTTPIGSVLYFAIGSKMLDDKKESGR